jgi:hypothetical protein
MCFLSRVPMHVSALLPSHYQTFDILPSSLSP